MSGDRFDELRELCTAAGDKASLAIGMAGLVMDHAYQARVREASQLASEAMALIESIGDATLTVGLSMPLIAAKLETGEMDDVLRWSQRVIDLADGDPAKGNFIIGSPLAFAFATRGTARCALGRPGWRDDLGRPGHGPQHRPLVLRRGRSLTSTAWGYRVACCCPTTPRCARSRMRCRMPSDPVMTSRWPSPDMALGLALVHRTHRAERERGQKLLGEVREVCLQRGFHLAELPIVNVYLARERARRGDRDDAIPLMRAAVDDLIRAGQLLAWGIPATGVLVETLLDRGADGDVAEAEAAIDRLAAAPADEGLVIRDIWLLRLRALLARRTATRPPTATIGIATAPWRHRLASKDI